MEQCWLALAPAATSFSHFTDVQRGERHVARQRETGRPRQLKLIVAADQLEEAQRLCASTAIDYGPSLPRSCVTMTSGYLQNRAGLRVWPKTAQEDDFDNFALECP